MTYLNALKALNITESDMLSQFSDAAIAAEYKRRERLSEQEIIAGIANRIKSKCPAYYFYAHSEGADHAHVLIFRGATGGYCHEVDRYSSRHKSVLVDFIRTHFPALPNCEAHKFFQS